MMGPLSKLDNLEANLLDRRRSQELKTVEVPKSQLPVRWSCKDCKKSGLFTFPSRSQNSSAIFEIALGIHRTISKQCKMHDVTLTGKDGVLQVVLSSDKSTKNQRKGVMSIPGAYGLSSMPDLK